MVFFLFSILVAYSCAQKNYSGDTLDLGGYGTLTFTLDSQNVSFVLESKTQEWMGIGFGSGMGNVDMFVAQTYNNTTVTVSDYYSQTYAKPILDEIQNLYVTGQKMTKTGYVVNFTRKLITGDFNDTDLTPGSDVVWAWAIGSIPNWDGGQKLKHRSKGNLNFVFGTEPSLTTQSSPKPSKKVIKNLTKIAIEAGKIAGESAGELAGQLAGQVSGQAAGFKVAEQALLNYPKKKLNNTQQAALQELFYSTARKASEKPGQEAGKKAGKIAGANAGAKAGAKAAISQKNEETVQAKATKAGKIAGEKAGKIAGNTAGALAGQKAAKIAMKKLVQELSKK